MKGFRIIGLGHVSLYSISSNEEFENQLDGINRNRIEQAWDSAVREKKGGLFNGTVLNCVSVQVLADRIVAKGTFISYKYFWAQRNLFQKHLSPVCLSLRRAPIHSDPDIAGCFSLSFPKQHIF